MWAVASHLGCTLIGLRLEMCGTSGPALGVQGFGVKLSDFGMGAWVKGGVVRAHICTVSSSGMRPGSFR